MTDDEMRAFFAQPRTIAVVGFSANPQRPSQGVSRFLKGKGHRIIPVNPGLAGQTFLGETVRASLAEIDEPVDMVDVFRASANLPGVVDDVLAMPHPARVLWTQLDVRHPEAEAKARDAGLTVVVDRCPHIEHGRLGI